MNNEPWYIDLSNSDFYDNFKIVIKLTNSELDTRILNKLRLLKGSTSSLLMWFAVRNTDTDIR